MWRRPVCYFLAAPPNVLSKQLNGRKRRNSSGKIAEAGNVRLDGLIEWNRYWRRTAAKEAERRRSSHLIVDPTMIVDLHKYDSTWELHVHLVRWSVSPRFPYLGYCQNARDCAFLFFHSDKPKHGDLSGWRIERRNDPVHNLSIYIQLMGKGTQPRFMSAHCGCVASSCLSYINIEIQI